MKFARFSQLGVLLLLLIIILKRVKSASFDLIIGRPVGEKLFFLIKNDFFGGFEVKFVFSVCILNR